jgi:tetratricopeptide (TPR) repeat protein
MSDDRTSDPTDGPLEAAELPRSTVPPGAADDPTRWREVARAGRFELALRQRLLAVGEGAEPDRPADAVALRTLDEVQGLLRDKAWSRAERRLEQLEDAPDWLDREAVERDVARLAETGRALERRDVDAALAGLAAFEGAAPGPFEAERLTQVGTARILDDEGEAAARCFERALEADPNHPRAIVNLGNVALEAGEVDRAIELYQRALQIDDGFANAHHNLGVAYRRKGEIGKSVRALRRAQRAERSRDASAAREDVRGLRNRMSGRRLRWLLWAVVAAVVVGFLLRRGG